MSDVLEKVGEVAKEVETKLEAVVEKTKVEVSDAEKFLVTKIENDFLKVQMQLQQLSAQAKNFQDLYTKKMEELLKKYELDAETWVFDSIEMVFKKKSSVPASQVQVIKK